LDVQAFLTATKKHCNKKHCNKKPLVRLHEGFARRLRLPADDALIDEYEVLHGPDLTPRQIPGSTARDHCLAF